MDDGQRDEIEMVVESVRVHMPTGRHVLVLRETDRRRMLLIWVGPWEASAIAMKLQGMAPERPLTHDLFVTVLSDLSVRLERIVISDLADETFHATLALAGPDERRVVDARPSDAIALAVRTGAPIFATADVLDRAATTADEEQEAGGETEDRADPLRRRRTAVPLESTDEVVDPGRLEIFREFVNSLDVEGDQRGGGASS
jgi:bifunctional DNase/RNase